MKHLAREVGEFRPRVVQHQSKDICIHALDLLTLPTSLLPLSRVRFTAQPPHRTFSYQNVSSLFHSLPPPQHPHHKDNTAKIQTHTRD